MTDWISVESSLPRTHQRVLIAYTAHHGRRAVTIGWYCKAKTLESAEFDSEFDEEYDEATDAYYLKEQWFDQSVESEERYQIHGVTHWMPLPALPEDQEGAA